MCETIREFTRRGVVIRTVINGLTFDGATTDPMQQAVRDALIAFMTATAQAQAEATKEAQKAGIEPRQRLTGPPLCCASADTDGRGQRRDLLNLTHDLEEGAALAANGAPWLASTLH